jgi:hypothetical protein
MGRTLLEADNTEIFRNEVSLAIGVTQTDRLVTLNTAVSANSLPTSIPVELNSVVQIRAKVLARCRSGPSRGRSAVFELLGSFKNIDGVVTQIDTTETICSHNDDNNWTVTFAVDGVRVYIQCTLTDPTLETGNTIIWTAYLYTFSVSE